MIILQAISRMRRAAVRSVVCALVVMMLAAGCGRNEEKSVPVELSSENQQDRNEDLSQDTGKDEAAKDQAQGTEEARDQAQGTEGEAENQAQDSEEDEREETVPDSQADSEKAEYQLQTSGDEELEGSVRSVGKNSFVISRITVDVEGDALIAVETVPGAVDEELITVYVNENCTYRYVAVRNSGINPEDISEREGSFADMKEGLTAEMKGSWKDGSFYADSMIMREFIH